MSSLANVGVFFGGFFGGLGVFFLGCAAFWAVSVWSRKRQA